MIVFGVPLFDLLFVAALLLGFVAGFVQGVIRRALGIASLLFAFFLAAALRTPVGSLLAANWTTLPGAYVEMLAFLGLFIVIAIASTVVIQGFYNRTPISEESEWLDELIGGALGTGQVILVVGMFIIILDSYYGLAASTFDARELRLLRTIWDAVDMTAVASFYRDVLIPIFIGLAGPFIPADIRRLYPA
ncbi:MAG: CvpA family protein [Chloroflexota bacterium]